MTSPCEQMAAHLGEMFTCNPIRGGVRVRTPFLYPDGDVIDVYVRGETGDDQAVSDLGETVRWLRMNTLAAKRSPKQNAMLQDTAQTHGVQFFKGTLRTRVAGADDLTAAILRVSQAALRASDIWFTFRTTAMQSRSEDVADFLRQQEVSFDRRPPLTGRSGRVWHPDFHTVTPARTALVFVLSTGSRSAAKKLCEHVVAAWHDLSNLQVSREPQHFVSLFDDTADIWVEEDYSLVDSLSEVARWSDPDGFIDVLKAA